MSTTQLVGAGIVTAILLVLSKRLFKSPQDKKEIPFADWQLASVNNGTWIYYMLIGRRDLFLLEGHKKYGPIFQVVIYGKTWVFVADGVEATRILKAEAEFTKKPSLKASAEGLLDQSLITLDTGATWKLHRQSIQPAFAPTHLRGAAVASFQVANDLAEIWRQEMLASNSTNKEISLWFTMNGLILDVMGKIMFSANFEKIKSGTMERKKEFEEIGSGFQFVFIGRNILPRFMWPLVGIAKDSRLVVLARAKLVAFMKKIISEAEESGASHLENEEDHWKMNFIDRVIIAKQEGKLDEDSLISEALTMFFAGQDTTATLITSVISLLSQNPVIQEKLYQEVKDFSVDPSDSSILNSVNHLFYLDQVIKETLRFAPGVPLTTRESVVETQILGFTVPQSTVIGISISAINHSDVFINPGVFDPDRWAPENAATIPSHAVATFGNGSRICIGQKMAIIEAKFVLLQLLPKFIFNEIGNQRLKIRSLVTTVPENLRIGLSLRN